MLAVHHSSRSHACTDVLVCSTHRKVLGDDWVVLHGICQGAVGPVLLLLAALPCRAAAAAAPLLPPLG